MGSLIGRISTIIGDRKITADEFADLEKYLFADGGTLDLEEYALLFPLIHPGEYESGDGVFSFEESTDQERLKIILEGGGLTVERYTAALSSAGITPRNTTEELGKTASLSMDDILPEVQSVKRIGKNGFKIVFKKDSAKIKWIVKDADDYSFRFDEFSPLTPEEVFLALSRCHESPETNPAQKQVIEQAQWLIGSAVKEAVEQKNLIEDLPTFRGAVLLYSELVRPQLDQKENPLFSSSVPVIYGNSPDEAQKRVIEGTLQSLPPGLVRILEEGGTSLHLWNADSSLKNFYNQYPRIIEPCQLGGLTFLETESNDIVLRLSKDARWFSYAVLHEITHAVAGFLDERVGGNYTPGKEQLGRVSSVLAYHFSTIRKPSREPYGKHLTPTPYSAFTEQEWLADVMAIRLAVRLTEYYSPGLDSLANFNQSNADLLEEFRREDPVGFLLVEKLVQYFEEGKENPEEVLSWTVYDVAREFADSHGGWINDAAVQAWRQSQFDFSVEKRFDEIFHLENENDRVAAMAVFYAEHPDFYPAQLSVAHAALLQTIAKKPYPLPESLKSVSPDRFFDLLRKHPFDPWLNSFLLYYCTYSPKMSQYRSLDEAKMKDPAWLDRMDNLTRELYESYPERDQLALVRAFFLKQLMKDYGEASKIFESLIEGAPPSKYKDNLYFFLADCYENMFLHADAEAIHRHLWNRDFHLEGYKKPAKLLAELYCRTGDTQKLLRLFLELADKDPALFVDLCSNKMVVKMKGRMKMEQADLWAEAAGKAQTVLEAMASDPKATDASLLALTQFFGF